VLNKHFQACFHMSKAESGFVQFSTYLAYFIMAVPAGRILKRLGYKRGLFTGLMLFALGAFAFVPAAYLQSPVPFLVALFILASGLCLIETGAHPYATILGPPESAAQRINVAAAFNGIGWIIGPILGGLLIFGADESDVSVTARPYMLVGAVVLVVAIALLFTRMPEIVPEAEPDRLATGTGSKSTKSIWKKRSFVMAVISQFCYVAAQTGIFSFFINYVLELFPSMSTLQASRLLGFGGMGLFFIGRLLSSFFMKWISPERLLAWFAALAAFCMILVLLSLGLLSLIALGASIFFMSMMFPTIFALGVRGLGEQTKQASSFIVMGVGGGAISPILMGLLGETRMATGFLIPLACFLVITVYGVQEIRAQNR